MNDPSNTPMVAGALFAFFILLMIFFIRKKPRREEITLRQFGQELLDETMPRWMWWLFLFIIVWKL